MAKHLKRNCYSCEHTYFFSRNELETIVIHSIFDQSEDHNYIRRNRNLIKREIKFLLHWNKNY